MPAIQETLDRLAQIPGLSLAERVDLSRKTRFGIGGPAEVYIESACETAFGEALDAVRSSGLQHTVVGGGTNLIVADAGFPGVALRFTAASIENEGMLISAAAGAPLQSLVDYSIERGLAGLHTMTGIPGSVGGAVYGNAGAYGHAIAEFVEHVRFHDGRRVRSLTNAECEFRYRESVFKRRKDWIIFSAGLRMQAGPGDELRRRAADILKIRNEKYPPTMRCAGSIFKNLILAELPGHVRAAVPENAVREGKAPSAWFLEQVGAKGMRNGDIQVAEYHANLIYNAGRGTARQVCEVIRELKSRVRAQFGFDLEEEVQYVGFGDGSGAA